MVPNQNACVTVMRNINNIPTRSSDAAFVVFGDGDIDADDEVTIIIISVRIPVREPFLVNVLQL